MKFALAEDAQYFLTEINRLDLLDKVTKEFTPDGDMIELFIKNRSSIVPKLKDFRKSQASKASWRKNRYKYMSGIKTFARSTEGKRFHRKLGNYLATRITKSDRFSIGYGEKFEALKAISSLRTHLYIENLYYHPVNEQVEFDLFMDEAVSATLSEEKRLYDEKYDFDEQDLDILCRAVDLKILMEEMVLVQNVPVELDEELFEQFNTLAKEENLSYVELLQKIFT